jgi:hypothetical protein
VHSAFDAPAINPNYLSVSYDADIMRAAFWYVSQIMRTGAALYGIRNIAPCTLAGAPFRCDPTLPDNIAGGAIKLTP